MSARCRCGVTRSPAVAPAAPRRGGRRRSSRSRKATRSPCSRAEMSIKQFRPMTPATRFRSVSGFDEVTRSTPEKSLLEPKRGSGGRNNQGHLTSRHRGGGHKRQYRKIDFKRNKFGIPARVAEIEYDPNRSARIALLVYADGEKRYVVAPDGLQVGQTVMNGPDAPPEVGNAL